MSTLRAAAQQEPVAWLRKSDNRLAVNDGGIFDGDWTPLYTRPPRREWRGLDKDETMHLMLATAWNYWADEAHIQRFARAVEAALKERNNG